MSTVTHVKNGETILELSETLFVPDLRTNLISIGKVTDAGYNVIFRDSEAEVVDRSGNILITAKRESGLYYLHGLNNTQCKNAIELNVTTITPKENSLQDWHFRMGHLNVKVLKEAIKTGSIVGVKMEDSSDDFQCRVCLQGKMSRPPFPRESKRSTTPGEVIHSYLCGPMRVESHGKSLYFITFINDCSRWTEILFIKRKSDAIEEFEKFRAFVSTQRGIKIKSFQTDNGKEYENLNFDKILNNHGTKRRLTAPYNPEQNDVAERLNRTLMESARCLLIQAGLPPIFWAEAVNTANFIHNRSPVSKLDRKSPYQAWHGSAPDVGNFNRFGNEVYIMDRQPGKGKLEPRASHGIFLGYSEESKSYRIWVSEKRRVEISRDVKFIKKKCVLKMSVRHSK